MSLSVSTMTSNVSASNSVISIDRHVVVVGVRPGPS
jgi:hypothetical protein